MKKRYLAAAAMTVCLLTAGCTTNYIPDLSDEEMQMVEEYAANLLLKYDRNYKATTISQEEFEAKKAKMERLAAVRAQIKEQKEREAQEKQEQEAASSEGGDGDEGSEGGGRSSGPVYTDIDEFFGINDFDIEYSGFSVSESYPEDRAADDWQGTVHASAGCSLVVVRFNVTNKIGEEAVLDMTAIAPRFTFRFNGSSSKASMMTLLLNDLSNYRETLQPGETREAVLVTELTADQAAGIESLTMIMKTGDSRAEHTLM
ncbi:MAG: hypothetical protein IKI75_07240 [Lachnospiraceae bacterium]|nr:hypothetical protein [Lachnospiraceae bacterium]